ncbi:MAG TPA: helix-turn-helix domain-containing protein [Polyangiaceae bacterium]|nr:helix-turn-helix domain-containing protein [Polyangiaceae bacterium]
MIHPIADEASHRKALRRAEQLWNAEPGSAGERELDALATLIDVYEQRTFPIEALGPLDAIKTRCEYLGWSRRDLEQVIGSRARVSEVLSGKRPLTLAMIRRLHEALDIPADILIAEVSPSVSKRPLARARKRAPSTRNAAEQGIAADGHLGRAARSLKARS